jgi:hypothetical protein
MAEVKKQLNKRRSSKAAKGKVKKPARKPVARARKTSPDEPPEANTNELLDLSVSDAEGGKILRKTAQRAVAARSEKIVSKLAELAEKGHTASTKILVALVSEDETGKPLSKRQMKYIGELEIEAECATSESKDQK